MIDGAAQVTFTHAAEDIERRIKAVALQHDDKAAATDIHVRGKNGGMLRLVAINEIGQPEIDQANVAKIVQEAQRAGVGLIIFDPYTPYPMAVTRTQQRLLPR